MYAKSPSSSAKYFMLYCLSALILRSRAIMSYQSIWLDGLYLRKKYTTRIYGFWFKSLRRLLTDHPHFMPAISCRTISCWPISCPSQFMPACPISCSSQIMSFPFHARLSHFMSVPFHVGPISCCPISCPSYFMPRCPISCPTHFMLAHFLSF